MWCCLPSCYIFELTQQVALVNFAQETDHLLLHSVNFANLNDIGAYINEAYEISNREYAHTFKCSISQFISIAPIL